MSAFRAPAFVALILLIAVLVPTELATCAESDVVISRIRRQPVESSAVAAIGYSRRLHALEIEFENGAIYRYLDVPGTLYRKLMSAGSKTRFYDEHVRGQYKSLHVRPRVDR